MPLIAGRYQGHRRGKGPCLRASGHGPGDRNLYVALCRSFGLSAPAPGLRVGSSPGWEVLPRDFGCPDYIEAGAELCPFSPHLYSLIEPVA